MKLFSFFRRLFIDDKPAPIGPRLFAEQTDRFIESIDQPIVVEKNEQKRFRLTIAKKAFGYQLGKSWTDSVALSLAEKRVYEYGVQKLGLELTNTLMSQHYYIRTGLMKVIEEVQRLHQVSEFLQTEILNQDRILFDALMSVGQPASPLNTLGIYCHWHREKEYNKPIIEPAVDGAAIALYEALKREISDIRLVN